MYTEYEKRILTKVSEFKDVIDDEESLRGLLSWYFFEEELGLFALELFSKKSNKVQFYSRDDIDMGDLFAKLLKLISFFRTMEQNNLVHCYGFRDKEIDNKPPIRLYDFAKFEYDEETNEYIRLDTQKRIKLGDAIIFEHEIIYHYILKYTASVIVPTPTLKRLVQNSFKEINEIELENSLNFSKRTLKHANKSLRISILLVFVTVIFNILNSYINYDNNKIAKADFLPHLEVEIPVKRDNHGNNFECLNIYNHGGKINNVSVSNHVYYKVLHKYKDKCDVFYLPVDDYFYGHHESASEAMVFQGAGYMNLKHYNRLLGEVEKTYSTKSEELVFLEKIMLTRVSCSDHLQQKHKMFFINQESMSEADFNSMNDSIESHVTDKHYACSKIKSKDVQTLFSL